VAAASAGATSMIDISDGLVADAWHVARASHATVVLNGNVVEATHGQTHDEILGGGDDYELLCTLPMGVELAGWQHIGVVEAGEPGVTVGGEPSPPRGYMHWRST
jgi:thiamine-monophosphate kinase